MTPKEFKELLKLSEKEAERAGIKYKPIKGGWELFI
jgi:hypothetical protein